MELNLESVVLSLMLAGTGAYTVYKIKKRREEIRKTIQVIELHDAEFWRTVGELRELAHVRA